MTEEKRTVHWHQSALDSDGRPIPEKIHKEFVLPSGRTALFVKRRGVAVVDALRKGGDDPARMPIAHLSEHVLIDGAPVLMEELEHETPSEDVMVMIQEFSGLGKPGQAGTN
uniref:Uncharacterized protein n=1 Tax=Candidatus Kentrum sp. TC TaxID=2126339 RepID=A0A450YWE0_9GAMM|nr:MAG: hypothetical protein BECKTC1821E_GA0114239_105412 [Candidatus Kentron sp. TC]